MEFDSKAQLPKRKESIQGNASTTAQKVKIEGEFVVAHLENYGLAVG